MRPQAARDLGRGWRRAIEAGRRGLPIIVRAVDGALDLLPIAIADPIRLAEFDAVDANLRPGLPQIHATWTRGCLTRSASGRSGC